MIRALLALTLAACGPSRAFVCQVDGVDVLDVQVPAQLGRLEVKRIEAYFESRNGKAIIAGCEAPR